MAEYAFAFLLITCGVLVIYFVVTKPQSEYRRHRERRQIEINRARHWREWRFDQRRQSPVSQTQLEREQLWRSLGLVLGAKRNVGWGGGRPDEVVADVVLRLVAGAGPRPEAAPVTVPQVSTGLRVTELVQLDSGLRVTGPHEPELLPGTFLQADAGLQLVPVILPQVSAGLRVNESGGPELAPGLVAASGPEPIAGALLQVSAGLQPEPSPVTLLQVDTGLQLAPRTLLRVEAGRQPVAGTSLQIDVGTRPEAISGTLLQIGIAPQAVGPSEPGPVPQTLLRADAGPRPVPATQPQVSPGRQAAEPVQVSAGAQVLNQYESGPAPRTLPRFSASLELVAGTIQRIEGPGRVGGRPAESAAGVVLSLAAGVGPRPEAAAVSPTQVDAGLQPAPGTLLLVGAGPQLVTGTILQAGAELREIGQGEPEPAPGQQVVNLYGSGPVPEPLTGPAGGRAGEAAAGFMLVPAGIRRLRVIEPGGRELELGTPRQVSVGLLQPLPGTLLRAEAGLQAADSGEPEPVANLQVIAPREPEPVPGTLTRPGVERPGEPQPITDIPPQLETGPRPELVSGTLLQPGDRTAAAVPSLAGGAGPQPELPPVTLLQVGTGLRVIELGETELVPVTLSQLRAGLQPLLGTLLQVDAGLQPLLGTLLRVDVETRAGRESLNEPEPTFGTLPQVSAILRPGIVSGILPQVSASLHVIELSEPKPVPGTLLKTDADLQVIELSEQEHVTGTLQQADAGLRLVPVVLPQVRADLRTSKLSGPELVRGTLLPVTGSGGGRPEEVVADVVPSLGAVAGPWPQLAAVTLPQVSADLRVTELYEPELAPETLLRVPGLGVARPAEFTADDVAAAFEMFAASTGQAAEIEVDDVAAAFEMFVAGTSRPAEITADDVAAAFEMFAAGAGRR